MFQATIEHSAVNLSEKKSNLTFRQNQVTYKYMEFTCMKDLFDVYETEVDGCDSKLLLGSFVKTWEKVLHDGYVDPETAVISEIRLKKNVLMDFPIATCASLTKC